MRAQIFPTEVSVSKDISDDTYTDVDLTDELGSQLSLHLTQDMLVELWKGLESPRSVGGAEDWPDDEVDANGEHVFRDEDGNRLDAQ